MTIDDCESLHTMWSDYAVHYAAAGYPMQAERFRRLANQMRDILASDGASLSHIKTINVREPEPPKRVPKIPRKPRKPFAITNPDDV